MKIELCAQLKVLPLKDLQIRYIPMNNLWQHQGVLEQEFKTIWELFSIINKFQLT